MENKITKITVNEFTDTVLITVDCDKETGAKITEFIAKLNLEIHTPKKNENP